ncbi:DUF1648 domain-containing protein [Alkalihalobacillus sp. LMS39]|uniref:DUF1648 domain-containing protein n=1 Tax=Alkalihalobacillus sp. LMS39 TaxID=2924032 RepID=UPI001FB48BA5|nr:DUF1648 domain-containing protein [Alkalihalobacillus sp. LMS39]UOE94664.1 DUF1648 domain-containing protein [Alkalihalobacillus sp. LMS39]
MAVFQRSRKWQWIDLISVLLFVCHLGYVVMNWHSLPTAIPIHFTISGDINNYGNKGFLALLPIVSLFLWIPFYLLEKRPHLMNLLNLTEENKARKYREGQWVMNIVKNGCLISFTFINMSLFFYAFEDKAPFGQVFFWSGMFFIGVVVIGPIIVFIQSLRLDFKQ